MGKLYEDIVSRETTNRKSNERLLSAYDQILEAEKKEMEDEKDKKYKKKKEEEM